MGLVNEHFEYRFVEAAPADMVALEAAGEEGWDAIALVPVEGALLVLTKRKLVVETHRSSLEATRHHLQGQLTEIDRTLAGLGREGWLPVSHEPA